MYYFDSNMSIFYCVRIKRWNYVQGTWPTWLFAKQVPQNMEDTVCFGSLLSVCNRFKNQRLVESSLISIQNTLMFTFFLSIQTEIQTVQLSVIWCYVISLTLCCFTHFDWKKKIRAGFIFSTLPAHFLTTVINKHIQAFRVLFANHNYFIRS